MDGIDCRKLQEYFNQIPGLIMIDMEGTVFYINDQCARYFQTRKEDFLGKYIKDVFPETKMMENLEIEEPTLVFYNSFLGIGISMHVPLYEDGKKVGLAEYDMVQHSERLYELSDSYKEFLDQELKQLAGELMTFEGTKYTINNLVGTSEPMTELKEKIISTAKTSSTVLITGETGTGKELVAHAIHNLSSRRKERFIKVNASSFPESLIESELFGYERGAFTGANREGRKGKFELADKGTLFIDEINQMPLSVQPKLLRALQEKEIDRIGGERPISVDVRIIAASNENLENLIKEGQFRKDLYYRLNVISLYIPPLRERIEDLESISRSIIDELNAQLGKSVNDIDDKALEMLKQKKWQGDVRELRNNIERAMNFATGNILRSEDFQWDQSAETLNINLPDLSKTKGAGLIDRARDDAEREVVMKVLEYFNNNKSKAAEYLDIARPSLYRKLKRLGID